MVDRWSGTLLATATSTNETATFRAVGDNYRVGVVFNDTGSTTDTPLVFATQTPNQNAVVGSALSLMPPGGTFNDPDGSPLPYSATGLNDAARTIWLTFNATMQTFNGTPTSANIGTAGVQVSATDPANLSATEAFNMAVTTTTRDGESIHGV
ncbi:putative Ig domain-containing protein [Bradyrhizobium sp. Leo121]|uniref:putative Ig domain-containing protein n=1 Tax=Bradyrhizobium sp. Leo121 TaxID=1571195 RepID=UPI00102A0CB9|nr:putative Ig domain-containing protein [Bradyrhizobium sp. Leo121]RZN26689.1 hypothetical protein CWO90_25915 [Bradyrhizobium sp. Leo121]